MIIFRKEPDAYLKKPFSRNIFEKENPLFKNDNRIFRNSNTF